MAWERSGFHRRLIFEIPAEAETLREAQGLSNASTEIEGSRPIRNYTENAYATVGGRVSRDEFDRASAERRAFTFAAQQAALPMCAQLLNLVPETETKFCLVPPGDRGRLVPALPAREPGSLDARPDHLGIA
jgi:hypothetical protein